MTKYIAPRKSIQLTDDIPGDSFLLEDGSWGMSLTAVGETMRLSSKSIGSLVNKNDPKALACKAFLCEDVPVEGSNRPVTIVKSPGVALIWQMVAESTRIAQAKRDRAVSFLASFTADKLEDIHSHIWGKARSYQESLEYRTETQRYIETALSLYRIWVEFIEANRSASLPSTWTGKPNSKGLPGITLTEDMWKVLSFYKNPYLVKVPGKKYAQEMTYDQVKAQGLLDQPVGGIPYYDLKEALKYSLQQLSLDDRVKNIPKKYWSHGLLAALFQDAEGFDKAAAAAEKREAKAALLDDIEDEVLRMVDEEGQPLTAKKQRQIAIKELKRLEATKVAEEKRIKKIREDYLFGDLEDELSSYSEVCQPSSSHSIKTPGTKLTALQLDQYLQKQRIPLHWKPDGWRLSISNGMIIGVMHDINNWTWKPTDESHEYWVLTTDLTETRLIFQE